jgi:hypothetical protein
MMLKADAQRDLTSAVTRIVRSLHLSQHAKRARIADIGGWDGKVGAVDNVGKNCTYNSGAGSGEDGPGWPSRVVGAPAGPTWRT